MIHDGAGSSSSSLESRCRPWGRDLRALWVDGSPGVSLDDVESPKNGEINSSKRS
jgi:hypothetical protein